jgi:hypothetical protein
MTRLGSEKDEYSQEELECMEHSVMMDNETVVVVLNGVQQSDYLKLLD